MMHPHELRTSHPADLRPREARRRRHRAARPLTLSAIPALLLCAAPAAGDIVFVNASQLLPDAFQTGGSWATAFDTLQEGLAAAISGDEVWVAQGTYKPTTGTDRNATFALKSGVKLYGGFEVGDTLLSQQDAAGNPTILSGEIGGASTSDNSLHVVTGAGMSASTLLDGFRIEKGNADNGNGAGATLTGTGMTVRNCTFANNLSGSGSGLFCNGALRIVGCTFEGNTSTGGGAAIRATTSSPRIVGCGFFDNHSTSVGTTGGAVFLFECANATVANCVFAGNSSPTIGGALGSNSSTTTIDHCTFVGNASGDGGAIDIGGTAVGLMSVSNSIFSDNDGGANEDIAPGGVIPTVQFCLIGGAFAGGLGCFDADPVFEDVDGADGVAGTSDDDLRLHRASPCVDAGSHDLTVNDVADIDGDGSTVEKLPLDRFGGNRFVNEVTKNTGAGVVQYVDLGAHELDREEIIWCVDADASAGGFGASWDDPFTTLQEAFDRITDVKFGEPAEIWVADGTYRPTTTTDRTRSFDIPAGARVLGGFAGFEGSRSLRDLAGPPSILSGDIGAAVETDNSFHVVVFDDAGINLDNTCLDGFTVVDGRATGTGTNGMGGGIFITNVATPRIRNCRIVNNVANKGGGIATSGPGGGIVFGCVISGNSALTGDGGGAHFENSGAPSLLGCTIVDNRSFAGRGGGVFWNGATSVVGSSILFHNVAALGDGQLQQMNLAGSSFSSVSFSDIQCFEGLFSAGGNIGADPAFVDRPGPDGLPGTLDDDLRLLPGSPCIDIANFANVQPDKDDLDDDGITNGEKMPVDLLGDPRQLDDAGIPNGQGGLLAYDIGALEFQGTSPAPGQPADFDHDGDVDGADLGLLLAAFFSAGPVGDLNNDCFVDGADLGLLLAVWEN